MEMLESMYRLGEKSLNELSAEIGINHGTLARSIRRSITRRVYPSEQSNVKKIIAWGLFNYPQIVNDSWHEMGIPVDLTDEFFSS